MPRGSEFSLPLRRRVWSVDGRLRHSHLSARAMASKRHPVVAQIVRPRCLDRPVTRMRERIAFAILRASS